MDSQKDMNARLARHPFLLAILFFFLSVMIGVTGKLNEWYFGTDGFIRATSFVLAVIGFATFAYSLFWIVTWFLERVIGRYEWIYVMPDETIDTKPNYDDDAFRKSDRIYRMKVGGWFRVSRQMLTPFEGKRIDHTLRFDGDGDMTITLPHAKFTVPVSVAMQYIGWFGVGGSDFGATLDSLLRQVKGLRRLSEENRQEVTILENHLRGLLCRLRGDGKDRPAKWITKLRDDIISSLREELPHSSNLRREPMIAGEDSDPNLDSFNGALLLRGEKPFQESSSASNS